jgi:hypothetical protein
MQKPAPLKARLATAGVGAFFRPRDVLPLGVSHPPTKTGTLVLDFANEADEIKIAFEPYYETTLLPEATDPNLLYEIQSRLAGFPVHTQADVDRFARIYFDRKATQDQLYQALAPVVERAPGRSPRRSSATSAAT